MGFQEIIKTYVTLPLVQEEVSSKFTSQSFFVDEPGKKGGAGKASSLFGIK